jgi:hypothetical protein
VKKKNEAWRNWFKDRGEENEQEWRRMKNSAIFAHV